MICAMSVAAAVAPDEYRSRRRSSERARRTASTYIIAECKAMREELRAMAHRSVRPLKPFFRTLLR
jgi:hypothetical protein